MKATQLETDNPLIKLVEPEIGRDAQLGVEWLNSEVGRTTLTLMGNSKDTVDSMLPTSLDKEAKRVEDFLERNDQLNWMIEYERKVVGSAWVDLEDTEDLPGPSVHIMIGEPIMRGKGVGKSTISAVLDYLSNQGYDVIYSRHMTSNKQADKLLKELGFEDLYTPYARDGVEYQNLVMNA